MYNTSTWTARRSHRKATACIATVWQHYHDYIMIQAHCYNQRVQLYNNSIALTTPVLARSSMPHCTNHYHQANLSHFSFWVCPCIKASGLSPALVQQQLFRGQKPCSLNFLPAIYLLFHIFGQVLLTLIPPYSPVKMISKSFLALLIITLTSSIIAAPIAPNHQFSLGLIVWEGLY